MKIYHCVILCRQNDIPNLSSSTWSGIYFFLLSSFQMEWENKYPPVEQGVLAERP